MSTVLEHVDRPWWLLLLVLSVPALLLHGQRRLAHGWLPSVPADPLSQLLSLALRVLAALVVTAAVLGLAGLHRQGRAVPRLGTGAHIVLVLDRSASMSDSFAGDATRGFEEAKAGAAARLLDHFVEGRPQDLFGVEYFSTAPIHVLDLSDDHEAVRAAVVASRAPGTGLTNVAAALSMALDQFRNQPLTGSRVVLLVTDGAARISRAEQFAIRRQFVLTEASLYWIFLRAPNGVSPAAPPSMERYGGAPPEHLLHTFFSDLGVPYHLYEAESPDALQQAIADVGKLENRPLRYLEAQPREALSPACYAFAAVGTLLLLGARLAEVRTWR